ncbi:DUF72 domain-containing protein [Pediococcus siamensis]|uniref:DUF72 domain-containing protein n=1 Tax=Pediococcus siamensis TaxID=381829 RepID=UPI0039A1DC8D
MITIGLTTWTDHPALIQQEERKVELTEYAGYFPVVEVDTSFYGIPRITTVENWQKAVPEKFQFILKANQLMTLHDAADVDDYLSDEHRLAFTEFRKMVRPLVKRQQLKTILFQFPPYFNCVTENIRYLRDVRVLMGDLPIAVEFRNASWYDPAVRDETMLYLKKLKMTHVSVDEPRTVQNGVPLVATVTNPQLAIVRLHGQNAKGWAEKGPNWRKTRTLYKYSEAELQAFAQLAHKLETQADEVCFIFNNNSGKDAAGNALRLKEILGINFEGLGPLQLGLF